MLLRRFIFDDSYISRIGGHLYTYFLVPSQFFYSFCIPPLPSNSYLIC